MTLTDLTSKLHTIPTYVWTITQVIAVIGLITIHTLEGTGITPAHAHEIDTICMALLGIAGRMAPSPIPQPVSTPTN